MLATTSMTSSNTPAGSTVGSFSTWHQSRGRATIMGLAVEIGANPTANPMIIWGWGERSAGYGDGVQQPVDHHRERPRVRGVRYDAAQRLAVEQDPPARKLADALRLDRHPAAVGYGAAKEHAELVVGVAGKDRNVCRIVHCGLLGWQGARGLDVASRSGVAPYVGFAKLQVESTGSSFSPCGASDPGKLAAVSTIVVEPSWLDPFVAAGASATVLATVAAGAIALLRGRKGTVALSADAHLLAGRCVWETAAIFGDSFVDAGEGLATSVLFDLGPREPDVIGWRVAVTVAVSRFLRRTVWAWDDRLFVAVPAGPGLPSAHATAPRRRAGARRPRSE